MFPPTFAHTRRRTLFALFGLLLLVLTPLSALAQEPPHPPIPIEPPMRLIRQAVDVQLHSVEATIEGNVAAVHVTQRFFNPSPQQLEGRSSSRSRGRRHRRFPDDGGRPGAGGKLYSADEARAIYEQIVRSLRDPALLEYVGQGLFQASVFPIPAGAMRTVELTYRQVLSLEDGLYRFAVPLGSGPNYPAPQTMAVGVTLRDQPGLRTVYSPSHNVSVQRQGDDRAVVGFETNGWRRCGDLSSTSAPTRALSGSICSRIGPPARTVSSCCWPLPVWMLPSKR
ncbi:MAG: VIT domain-containing protein [Caldilineaceae bacterium]